VTCATLFVLACFTSCHPRLHAWSEGGPQTCAWEFDETLNPMKTKTVATRDTTLRAGEVVGTILWANSGKSAGEAKISATSDSTSGEYSTLSDEEGRFHLDRLPLGRMLLQARRIGLHTDTVTIDTRTGNVVQFALHNQCAHEA
jgi:hypothetical protein